MKRHEELGLNPDEEAFYDALADRPEVLLSMGDATLKKTKWPLFGYAPVRSRSDRHD